MYVYFFNLRPGLGVKAQSQRSIHPLMDKNYDLRIMTVAFLLVLLMFSEKCSALAPQGKCIFRPFLHQRFSGIKQGFKECKEFRVNSSYNTNSKKNKKKISIWANPSSLLKWHFHAIWHLYLKPEGVSASNDLVLVLKTIWMYWNCFLSPVATDDMDENGLKPILMLRVSKIL